MNAELLQIEPDRELHPDEHYKPATIDELSEFFAAVSSPELAMPW